MSNKFQRKVIKETKKKIKELDDAFCEKHGHLSDKITVKESPGTCENCSKIEFIGLDSPEAEKWFEELDKEKTDRQIKKEIKAEVRKGPRL